MSETKYGIAMDETRFNRSSSNLNIFQSVDFLSIKQQPSLAEAVFGMSMEAKFDVFNRSNEKILFAYEESTCCQRYWCPTTRRFTLHVTNNQKEEIMTLFREYRCCNGCCWCGSSCKRCQQVVTVESPPGQILGTITQLGTCWRMLYEVKTINDIAAIQILGPCCICDGPFCCCCENKFEIIGTDGTTEIGEIHKKYAGCCEEAFTSADNFTCQFPMNLDVKMKALLLAGVFVIDFNSFATVPHYSDNNS